MTGVCLGQELSLAASPVDWCSGSLDLNLPSSSTLEQLEGEGHTQPPDEPPCLISSRALLGGTWTGLFIQSVAGLWEAGARALTAFSLGFLAEPQGDIGQLAPRPGAGDTDEFCGVDLVH